MQRDWSYSVSVLHGQEDGEAVPGATPQLGGSGQRGAHLHAHLRVVAPRVQLQQGGGKMLVQRT